MSAILCQAAYCRRWAVEGHDLCDPHLEAQEDGHTVKRRTQPGYHKAANKGGRKERRPPTLADLPRKEQREALRQIISESRKTQSSRRHK